MKKATLVAVGGAALAALVVIRVANGRPSRDESNRWRTVTVAAPLDSIALPEPLSAFGAAIEVRFTAAPSDKGTQIAARFTNPQDTEDESNVGDLRIALRESKSLLETGEVIRLDPKPEGARPATPAGLLTDLLTRKSSEKGVL
jgi:hypothetical protein